MISGTCHKFFAPKEIHVIVRRIGSNRSFTVYCFVFDEVTDCSLSAGNTCDDTLDELMSSRGSERAGPTRTGRSRTRSSSEDNLLDCSHSSARLALQQEVLPGAVKSGSLESLLRGGLCKSLTYDVIRNLFFLNFGGHKSFLWSH